MKQYIDLALFILGNKVAKYENFINAWIVSISDVVSVANISVSRRLIVYWTSLSASSRSRTFEK